MAKGELSVEQMRKAIEAGQTVSYRGRLLRDVRDLPSEAENAVTVEEKLAARKALQAEHDARQQELDRLDAEIEESRANSRPAPRGKAASRQSQPAEDEGDEDDNGGDEPQFAGHPLSHFEKLAKGSKDTAEARSRIMSVKGVGEATADQILAALNDQE